MRTTDPLVGVHADGPEASRYPAIITGLRRPRIPASHTVTHGRPGWRAVMIRWAVRQPPQVLLIAVSGSSSVRRAMEQLRELQPDVDELRSQHGRNQREFKQSLMDLFEVRGIAPFKGSWPLLATMLVGVAYEGIVTAGVLRPPRRQGLHDRLAHILVLDSKEVG